MVQMGPVSTYYRRVSRKVLCSNPLGMRVSSVLLSAWVHSGCLLPHRRIGDSKLYLGVNVSVNTFVCIITAMNWWLFQGVWKVRGKIWTGEIKLFIFYLSFHFLFKSDDMDVHIFGHMTYLQANKTFLGNMFGIYIPNLFNLFNIVKNNSQN